jgi:hypothetical protein
LVRSGIRDPEIGADLWVLFMAVAKSPAKGGCNLYEFLRVFEYIPQDIIRSHVIEFVDAIFPLQFSVEPKLTLSTFIEFLKVGHFILQEILTNELFIETYRQFWRFPLQSPTWIPMIHRVKKLISRVASNRPLVGSAVIALLEERFPISISPVIAEVETPLDERTFQLLLDGVIRACDSRLSHVALTKLIFSEQVFLCLESNLESFPTVAHNLNQEGLTALVSTYLTPSLSASIPPFCSFLYLLSQSNPSISTILFDILLSRKEEFERDCRIVWGWLALRLYLCQTDEQRSACFEDAVNASMQYRELHGVVFIKAVLTVLKEGSGQFSEVLRTFLSGIEKANVWPQTTRADLEAAVETSGEILKAFSAICAMLE